ncbi:MAG TPA: hypothetical protein VFE86_06115 [Ilumatobacteraceae bacterium]|nr:hypothetical protein [Ilumatobacteraceae bacterium]
MNRRGLSIVTGAIATAIALSTLSSCATFNRNGTAAEVGGRTLSQKEVQELAGGSEDSPATADALRDELTKWIRVAVIENEVGTAEPTTPTSSEELDTRLSTAISALGAGTAETTYETGLAASPVICLAAITVANIDDANTALAAINSGTSFSDAAHQFSTDTAIADAGGVVKGRDGSECIAPNTVNPAVTTALKDTPVGQPIAADLGTFAAVLLLRPYDELSDASKKLIASASVPQTQLDAVVDAADIFVDPRYGRWDNASGSVVAMVS